jgi:copper chaperone CopZ
LFLLVFKNPKRRYDEPMKTTLKIEGMSCEHCVKHVKTALEGLGLDVLKAAVVEAGYEVV